MHGDSQADALPFETWALDGSNRGRQMIMLALPAIKRTFEEMHGSLGGEKHKRTVLGFEEDDFRIDPRWARPAPCRSSPRTWRGSPGTSTRAPPPERASSSGCTCASSSGPTPLSSSTWPSRRSASRSHPRRRLRLSGPARDAHVMERKEQTQARIERMEAAGFMTGPLRDLKKAVGDAAKLIATSHGAKAAEASKPLPKYAHH